MTVSKEEELGVEEEILTHSTDIAPPKTTQRSERFVVLDGLLGSLRSYEPKTVLPFGQIDAYVFFSSLALEIFLESLPYPCNADPNDGIGFRVKRPPPADGTYGNFVFLRVGILISRIFKQKAQDALEGIGTSELRTC
jgi:hypothetical protein